MFGKGVFMGLGKLYLSTPFLISGYIIRMTGAQGGQRSPTAQMFTFNRAHPTIAEITIFFFYKTTESELILGQNGKRAKVNCLKKLAFELTYGSKNNF